MCAVQGDCSQNADYVHVEVHGPRWERDGKNRMGLLLCREELKNNQIKVKSSRKDIMGAAARDVGNYKSVSILPLTTVQAAAAVIVWGDVFFLWSLSAK